MRKRILSFMLTLVMVIGLLSNVGVMTVRAAGEVTLNVNSSVTDDNAARAEGATYKTLGGAVAVALSGDTIKLLSAIDLGNNIDIDNKSLILDLNGQTISSSASGSSGAIKLANGASIEVVDATGNGAINLSAAGRGMYNDESSGYIKISGGSVIASADGTPIHNSGTGTGTIIIATTGTVSSATGNAIYNAHSGNITISSGTVSSGTGRAIRQTGTGKITISGNAVVASANVTSTQGTIHIEKVPTSSPKTALEITGGEVKNTASTEGHSVYFSASGITGANLSDYYTNTGGTVGKVFPEAAASDTVELWRDGSKVSGHATLAAAVTAATSGDTIKLLANID